MGAPWVGHNSTAGLWANFCEATLTGNLKSTSTVAAFTRHFTRVNDGVCACAV
jgi:hypothetical protein